MTKVSILVAARNEAANILDCLKALDSLTYSKENLQILIGNDQSEDNTAQLVIEFIKNKPHFELVNIGAVIAADSQPAAQEMAISNQKKLKGKANVLAPLAHKSTGDYYFFTDADIQVPTAWVENMLFNFKDNIGVVTGITTMKSWRALPQFQALEWLLALAFMRFISLFNIPLTGMGNNMAVSKTAYWAVGGYEELGFSVVEDYQLFKAITDKGFGFVQLFDRRIMAITKPIETYKELLVQRKRWLQGAMNAPIALRMVFISSAVLLPCLLLLALFFPKLSIILAVIHYVLIVSFLSGILSWLNISQLYLFLPFFWFYFLFNNFMMLVNYYNTKQTIWKGRIYD